MILKSTKATEFKALWIRQLSYFLDRERSTIRVLITFGMITFVLLFGWFMNFHHVGYMPLYVLFIFSVAYKTAKLLFEWYHYWSVIIPPEKKISRQWTVDMFTTAMPGEPYEMIAATLRAMKAVRYPHTTYLCDEGNDPDLKALCEAIDVKHITRTIKVNAKAGNINNALQYASGEICVILDPDHVPSPEFLDEVLPSFDDDNIGFVQIVQAYHNYHETWIAQGAAQQTYTFYGPLMMGMNSYGTVQAIGANCTFRRAALDSIGGHAPGLAEDMHTAMQLHAKGWKSVYLPKILAKGLVPTDIASYYQQQLKWSRGTFDLLLYVFPKLVKHFTWRQRIHYVLLPMHFAAGLFFFIDIFMLLFFLLTGLSPIKSSPDAIFTWVLPFLALILLIRIYAQKWLLQDHERTFHITGGILLFATWWIHLVGLIYTFFKINVPYIPTRKNSEYNNHWTLSLPNLFLAALCIFSAVYSLNRDWNPYNFFMAGCAFLIAGMLLLVVGLSQDRFIKSLRKFSIYTKVVTQVRPAVFSGMEHRIYKTLRTASPFLAVLILLFYAFKLQDRQPTMLGEIDEKQWPTHETGGFYLGLYNPAKMPEGTTSLPANLGLEKNFKVVSLYEAWYPESILYFKDSLLNDIANKGKIPMITWEPWVSSFPESKDNDDLKNERKAMAAIASGTFDDYLKAYANKVYQYGKPIFIRFAHEADNPAYPWSGKGGNTAEEYKAAWEHVTKIFRESLATNVTWVFTPWSRTSITTHYPGREFVDWVGITCLNYGLGAHDSTWRSFKDIYQPVRADLLKLRKPVMLAEFGSTNYGGSNVDWLIDAADLIKNHYTEIKSAVLFNSDRDRNWVTKWRPDAKTAFIDWTVKFSGELQRSIDNLEDHSVATMAFSKQPVKTARVLHNKSIKGSWGNYSLQVDGKPFYIRGVAYNTGQSWRDGNYPLTRNQLEKDFEAIQEMGCNTIRRYHPSIYDNNILTIASEKNLKVMFGFWFDPNVDYYKDSVSVKRYIKLVEQSVSKYKNNPAILGWNIGNETSGLMKNAFDRPYLSVVRKAYMEMIELMAKRIHELDTEHPVFTSLEHSPEFESEVIGFKKYAPSVDVIGVNSYYDEQISQVQKIFQSHDTSRPYLVSEFGPKGYWNRYYTDYSVHDLVLEQTDNDKSLMYAEEWKKYILKNKHYNVGGIAYCWQDRYEGSQTWFGLTDFQGRKKPTYYALQNLWLHNNFPAASPSIYIVGPQVELHANDIYQFVALAKTPGYTNFEWRLCYEDYLEESLVIKQSNNNKVTIKMPARPGNYRLYVYASNGQDNIVTASYPYVVIKRS